MTRSTSSVPKWVLMCSTSFKPSSVNPPSMTTTVCSSREPCRFPKRIAIASPLLLSELVPRRHLPRWQCYRWLPRINREASNLSAQRGHARIKYSYTVEATAPTAAVIVLRVTSSRSSPQGMGMSTGCSTPASTYARTKSATSGSLPMKSMA